MRDTHSSSIRRFIRFHDDSMIVGSNMEDEWPDNGDPRKKPNKWSKSRRLAFCFCILLLILLLVVNLASMEPPTSWAAVQHEFHYADLTAAQQKLDFRCGLPKLHSATDFAPSGSKRKRRTAESSSRHEQSTRELANLGIHFMFALADGVPCPTDVPAKYACSLESAVATGMPVNIWMVPFKSRKTCRMVRQKGYTLLPLEIDAVTPLGRWYHDHRHDLWTQKFPNQAARSIGQQGDLSIVADFLRLYVLRYRGGGTYMDMDVHVLDSNLFNHLPESVAAQEQSSALKFHGLHRYNKYD